MRLKIKGVACATAIGLALCAPPAMADSLVFDGLWYSGADTVHIVNTPSSQNDYVYSGGFKMRDTTAPWTMGDVTVNKGQSFLAFCIDIFDNMQSYSYNLKTTPNLGTVSYGTLTPTRQLELERLASNNLSMVVDAKTSSAFQLAAWEIMADTGSVLNVKSGAGQGSFYTYGDALGADTLANQWLSNLGSADPSMKLYVWEAAARGATQDLAVFAPVPEPETYAMMLAGLGMLAVAARKRKQQPAASAVL